MNSSLRILAAGAFALFLANCASESGYNLAEDGKYYTNDGEAVNPFEPGTYEHFKAEKEYPKTSKVWKNEQLLSLTTAENSRLVVSLGKQRAFLMNGDEVAIDYPISSGKSGFSTPAGEYTITEKTIDKKSNAYGKVYDAEGNRIYGKETPDAVPEGGRFAGAPMPYWMRLTNDGVGHHIGNVRRYPASHGCIRGPRAILPTVYRKVKLGTPVSVVE